MTHDLNWKEGRDPVRAGPGLRLSGQLESSLGKLMTHRFWQMYTHSVKSQSVLSYSPLQAVPPTDLSVCGNPHFTCKRAHSTAPSQNMKQLPGIK